MVKTKSVNFEASLRKLEEIVKKLEEGDLSLEESLKIFEEGMGLVKQCETRLNEAQKKVEILMKGREGKKTAVPFSFEEEEEEE